MNEYNMIDLFRTRLAFPLGFAIAQCSFYLNPARDRREYRSAAIAAAAGIVRTHA